MALLRRIDERQAGRPWWMDRAMLWMIVAIAILPTKAPTLANELAWDAQTRTSQRVESDAHTLFADIRSVYGIDENADATSRAESGELDIAVASWWGFDSGNATDAMQAAIDSGASTVVVPAMDSEWLVDPIVLTHDDQTILFEQDVVVRARAGGFRGRNDCLFEARNRDNLTLIGYGAVLAMRKREYWQEPYAKSQWRHALSLRGCRNVTVLGLEVRKSGGDGIYLGTTDQRSTNENVVIRHVICDDNHRQGMSVISARNLLVEHCVFSNTRGTAPMAGIDLEPNSAEQALTSVVIRRCLFLDNDQLGMHTYLGNLDTASEPVSILWADNYVRGSEIGIHLMRVFADGPGGFLRFQNNVIEGTMHAGILARVVSSDSGLEISFQNNVLRHTATGGPYDEQTKTFYKEHIGLEDPADWWRHRREWPRHFPSAPIVLHGQIEEVPRQGGLSFDGDLIIEQESVPAMIVSGTGNPEGEDIFETWSDVEGRIRVLNPHGAWLEQRVPVEDFQLQVNGVDASISTRQ